MNVLILAAGQVVRGSVTTYPSFLMEVGGKTLIEITYDACARLAPARCLFALHGQDIDGFQVDAVVGLLGPNATAIRVAHDTQGAGCTALLAIDHIDNDDELVIANITDFVDADWAEIVAAFRDSGADAGTVVFDSLHPRYSFVRLDDDGNIVEAAEKRPISRNATAGLYWFRRGADFVRAAKAMIRKDAHFGGKFFIAPTLNELILEQKLVRPYVIPQDRYYPLKTPELVEKFRRIREEGPHAPPSA